MDQITEKAYAKINLSLDVTGRRADGYHLVKMVMQTVGIYDTLCIKKNTISGGDRTGGAGAGAGSADEQPAVRLVTASAEIPAGADNLVVRAAERMREAYGIRDRLTIELDKQIPVAAGMAGGSTDAAAVLRGIARMYGICGFGHGRSGDAAGGGSSAKERAAEEERTAEEEIARIAVSLGADVPFCLRGGTQLCEGIGEVLTPLPDSPACHLVIARPDIPVSTPAVYRAYDDLRSPAHPDADAMTAAIRAGDLAAMCAAVGNVLAEATVPAHPEIGILRELLSAAGAMRAEMTGSGPTVFAVFDDIHCAAAAKAALERFCEGSEMPPLRRCRVFHTTFVDSAQAVSEK